MSYFKTLKSLIISTGIVILINIIVYIIYAITHLDQSINGLSSALFKNTIGNVAAGKFYFLIIIY